MNFAFITPEFITENARGGGLANYLNRMSTLLVEQGHAVEIFVLSEASETVSHGKVLVHRVRPDSQRLSVRAAWKVANALRLTHQVGWLMSWYASATAMANAVAARQKHVHFDLIQSADLHAVGLRVKPTRGTVHIVRSSSAADLLCQCEGHNTIADRGICWLERRALRRADRAYAPSRFAAEHFRNVHGLDVHVVRPPAAVEVTPSPSPPMPLPPRFFLHFGQIKRYKGSEHLARALPRVWEQCPDFTMVWAGLITDDTRSLLDALKLADDPRLVLTGAVPKPDLYAILKRAQASVLPSLVDNLPNTVIESLMTGVPVIGFDGASVDELVDDPAHGDLVPMHDTQALADILIRRWRHPLPAFSRWSSAIATQMHPPTAIGNLLTFAGLADSEGDFPDRRRRKAGTTPRLPVA